jgi:predicted NBD/HSP70 family sugar kinase
MSLGVAKSVSHFAYLQIGVRLGAGLVIDGQLRRGAGGGGGEIARIPFPMRPARELTSPDFSLEKYVGSAQLLNRLRDRWPDQGIPPPESPEQLFALASEGNAPALRELQEYANDIAQIAMVLCAVVDPELIVLGGGIGQNPALGRLVEESLHREHPEVELQVSTLGRRATVEGAVALATDYARTQLLGMYGSTSAGGVLHGGVSRRPVSPDMT